MTRPKGSPDRAARGLSALLRDLRAPPSREGLREALVRPLLGALALCLADDRGRLREVAPHTPSPRSLLRATPSTGDLWRRWCEALRASEPTARWAPEASTRVSVSDRAFVDALKILLPEALDLRDLGTLYEGTLGLAVVPSEKGFALDEGVDRRRAGAHYTPRSVAVPLVARTLGPLVGEVPLERLRVCDPALGCGHLLLEALAFLRATTPSEDFARGIESALYGVDRDATAVELARYALWLSAGADGPPWTFAPGLRVGDALVENHLAPDPLVWERSFPEVFARGGFDAVLGNPPWVSYAGRAAQPLDPALHAHYRAHYASFAGYRNLQGLFVERAARVLRPGGRLGLVLPSSMSEQGGYEPVRRAHARWCLVDPELPDFGEDRFEDVVQPCMALLSTRREAPVAASAGAPWPVERGDLGPEESRLLAALQRPPLPPHLFGERGVQSTPALRERFVEARRSPDDLALLAGSDVREFTVERPSLFVARAALDDRWTRPTRWSSVQFYVRQTASWTIAAPSTGEAFRNTLLAGFCEGPFDRDLLVAWLNATLVRWRHHASYRDARQGIAQVKIAHLRAVPAPPLDRGAELDTLRALGRELGARNRGITDAERALLDRTVAAALDVPWSVGLTDAWRARQTARGT